MSSVFGGVPEGNFTFSCIDGHTCGNPVRLVTGGGPLLRGATMSERRQDFLARFDWVRRALMFEPRGHDVMSGSMLYPPTRPDCDVGVLFIEVSGCLPMCGHGTIGTVTMAVEHVDSVRITNVPSYLAHEGVAVDVPGLGELVVDIAYGGNYYAIVEPQKNYAGIEALGGAGAIQRLSPVVRRAVSERIDVVHPLDPTIRSVSHVMWTDRPRAERAHARNAVFYGDKAVDRSPCGTGTSARMAQLAAKGRLHVGDDFVHESIIGTMFDGRVEAAATVGPHPAIVPSVAGWARMHGINTIFVNGRDPLRGGFQLA